MTLHLLARPHHPAAPASGMVWKMLFDRQVALLHRWARPEFKRTLADLGLRRDTLPNLQALSQLVHRRTGWTLLVTSMPVAEAVYYAALARRELPVVSRLRTFSEFDQPPGGPDLFADVFGRVPLLLEAGYADALQALGQAWELATTPPAVALLRRFAQVTFELGMIAQAGGRPQFYGATLLTSARHLHAAAAAEATQYQPLSGVARHLSLTALVAAGMEVDPAPFFVAASWAELTNEIQSLRVELLKAQRPEIGSRVVATAKVDGRAHAFAARLSGRGKAS